MINEIYLEGNIVRDPESRNSQSGMLIVTFDIAVNRRRKDGESEADFFSCKTFSEYVMNDLVNHCKKGDRVFIKGKLTQQKWIDKNTGGNRSKNEIIVENLRKIERLKNETDNVVSPSDVKSHLDRNSANLEMAEKEDIPF